MTLKPQVVLLATFSVVRFVSTLRNVMQLEFLESAHKQSFYAVHSPLK